MSVQIGAISGLLKISTYRGSIGVIGGQGIGIYDEVKQYLLRLTNEFYIKLLAFNLWVHHGDSMYVGKRNPHGTVTL